MATVALIAAGTAIANAAEFGAIMTAVTTGLFAGLGSFIDQRYVFPKLLGSPDDVQDPSLADINYFSFEEGKPAYFPVGCKCESEGHVIWMTNISTQKTTMLTGKGGGSRPYAANPVIHYSTLAVAIGIGKEIVAITEVYADEKKIYTKEIVSTNTDTVIVAQKKSSVYINHIYPGSTAFGPAGTYEAGQSVTISGYNNAVLNGDFTIVSLNTYAGGSYMTVYNPQGVDESSGVSKTFYQLLVDWTGGLADSVEVHLGGAWQDRSDVMVDQLGVGVPPAFRGVPYIVFENLNLTEFGNRLPSFRMVYEANYASITAVEAIQDYMTEARLDPEDYDLTRLPSGMIIFYMMLKRGIQKVSTTLQPVMIFYNLLSQEHSGKIWFFHKVNCHTVEIETDHLSARQDGESVRRRAWIERKDKASLPSSVKLAYIKASNVEKGTEYSTTTDLDEHENVLEVNTPLAHWATTARAVANRIRANSLASRHVIQIRVPASYFYIVENDIVQFQDAEDRTWFMLVQKKDRGENGVIVLEGVSDLDWSKRYLDTAAPESGEMDLTSGTFLPPLLLFKIIDLAPFSDQHHDRPGFYIACSCLGDASIQTWLGATIYQSLDGGANYDPIAQVPIQSVMAVCISTLGGGVSAGSWDRVNTLTVLVPQDTLSSATESEVLKGGNTLVVGDEVIGFANATLQTPEDDLEGYNKYILDTFLRGLRGTESEIDSHAAGELAVLMNEPGVEFVPCNIRAINETRYYKAVPTGGDAANYEALSHTHVVGNARCLPVCTLEGDRSGYDVVVTWTRRTRLITQLFAETPTPIEEPKEIYEIDFFNASDGLLRTKTVEDATTVTYTSSEQSADGVSLGATIKVKVYQMSKLTGRGRVSEYISVPYP